MIDFDRNNSNDCSLEDDVDLLGNDIDLVVVALVAAKIKEIINTVFIKFQRKINYLMNIG